MNRVCDRCKSETVKVGGLYDIRVRLCDLHDAASSLLDAARVIVLTKSTRMYLVDNDPKALEQTLSSITLALRGHQDSNEGEEE